MEKYNIKQITLITLALMLNPVFAEEAVKRTILRRNWR
jgi:hypothetical protein